MDRIWIIPITLAIIGWFGIFWTLNLSNAEIYIRMDDNTKDAIKSINETLSNLEIPNLMIYNYQDCELIHHRKEYWCYRDAPLKTRASNEVI